MFPSLTPGRRRSSVGLLRNLGWVLLGVIVVAFLVVRAARPRPAELGADLGDLVGVVRRVDPPAGAVDHAAGDPRRRRRLAVAERRRPAGRHPPDDQVLPLRHRPGRRADGDHPRLHQPAEGDREPRHLHDRHQADDPAGDRARQGVGLRQGLGGDPADHGRCSRTRTCTCGRGGSTASIAEHARDACRPTPPAAATLELLPRRRAAQRQGDEPAGRGCRCSPGRRSTASRAGWPAGRGSSSASRSSSTQRRLTPSRRAP